MGQFSPLAILGIIPGGDVMSGYAQKSADEARAAELRQEAQSTQAQGQEQQAARLDALNRSVGAIGALTASRGLNADSPSSQAVIGQRKKTANTDVAAIGANTDVQAGLLREDALASIMAGNNAALNGWFSAASDIGKMFG